MMAWLAPLLPVGYITCAASPISATRPSTQVGTGSRSIIGYSNTSAAPRSIAGTSSLSKFQPSKWWAKSASCTRRFQSPWVQPSRLSTVISAIQLIVASPVAGSTGEIG